MRISHLASIAFACSISLFSTASFAQSPSEDGLCGELLHGETPSLYGLCIAYWATQNNGNSDASSKILEKYDARKPEDGPDMPGLCPCWTAGELLNWEAALGERDSICYENTGSNKTATGWSTLSGPLVQAYSGDEEDFDDDPRTCSAVIENSSGRFEYLDPNQYLSCFNDALASAERVGCSFP